MIILSFPLSFPCSPELLNELALCEEGSYDDALDAELRHETPERDPVNHTYVVARRHKRKLEIRNEAELADVWYALCSGTTQVHKPRAVDNLAAKMRPYVALAAQHHECVRKVYDIWQYPSGM